MNFVPCVAWVSKGVAASYPQKVSCSVHIFSKYIHVCTFKYYFYFQLQLSPDELKRLVNETKELCG